MNLLSMACFQIYLFLIFSKSLLSIQAQTTSEEPNTNNLKTFVADNVRIYGEVLLSLPYIVSDNLFRGGDVASNYIVNTNETQTKAGANWEQNPEVILDVTDTIQIRYQNFFTSYAINGKYTLEGLENAVPVFGEGAFNISTSLTELNFYFFYEVEENNHLSIVDSFNYYSSFQPTSFAFSGSNSSNGGGYQKSIATAISQFSMQKMIDHHKDGLMEFLRCLFEKITYQEIETGGKVNPCECISDCSIEASEAPSTIEVWSTTELATTEYELPTEDPTTIDDTDEPTTQEPTDEPTTPVFTDEPMTSESSTDEPTTEAWTIETTSPTTEFNSPTPTTQKPPTTTTRPTSTTTTPNPDIPFNCSDKPDGYYQHPSNCSKFLGCLNGAVREYSCPTFLVFSPDRLTCVHPNEYTCPFEIFSCSGLSDGYYASPLDCAKYFGCLDGQLFKELSCLFDYYFDQKRQQCVPPSQSDCYRQFELFEETHRAFHL